MNSPESYSIVYETVVIRFTRQIFYDDERTFQLEVLQSPAPLPGGAFQADIEPQLEQFHGAFLQRVTMSHFFNRFATSAAESSANQDVSDLGHQIYELLPLSFRQAFPRLVQGLFEQGHGLRLVLEAQAGDKADRLLSLPWELLFFKETEVYLARTPRVLVVRRLLDAVRRSSTHMQPPFSVVHVIANDPTASERHKIEESLQQTEKDSIKAAIQSGHYHLVEKPGSIEKMLAVLREQPYHIVHFLGHGEMHSDNLYQNQTFLERGYLQFMGDNNKPQWVTGEQFQNLLEFSPSVQLVILDACHSGANVIRSIALELTYHGLPYVVAIQGAILQESAKFFIEAFYTELQRGGTIAYAVAVGRAAIAAHMPHTMDWCLPVLYTSVGLSELSAEDKTSERLWQWMSDPLARRRLGLGNIAFAILHLVVGLLLLLSGQVFALPVRHFVNWITGISVTLPVITVLFAQRRIWTSSPQDWPLATKLALSVRALAAASIGFGIPILYTWLFLLLVVALGFWGILVSVAQSVMLALVFLPSMLWSYWFGRSQIQGHVRAFISNANVELPDFEWAELAIVFAGYILLLLPWFVLTFLARIFMPPWGNLLIGVLLLIIGYVLWRDTTD